MFAYLSRRRTHLNTTARLRQVIAALAVVTSALLGWAAAVPAASAAVIPPPSGPYGPVTVTPGVLGGTHSAVPQDSGLVACAYPLATQDVPATDYPKIRAEFAGSRWADLRNAGTAYVDLATALLTARDDGYQTVWFYQRLSAACAKHGRSLNGST